MAMKLFLFTLLATWAMTTSTMASAPSAEPTPSLTDRLQSNESSKCWDSMLEINSCIGEFIMFFLNGETYIGPGCCQAIRTIVHECRPSMLNTLGFTSEESHVLDDYCEGAEDVIPPPPPPSTMIPLMEDLNH